MNTVNYKTMQRLVYTQLMLYCAVWLFGIYINGFELSPSETGRSPVTFFFSPVVVTHFLLAALIAAVEVMLMAMSLVYGLRRSALLGGLSLASIAIASTGGLTFVFGVGNQNIDSMLMATGFITALYLGFFAALCIRPTSAKQSKNVRLLFHLSIAVLTMFYVVFLSGMYVNLFVASAVFSEPPAIAQKMLEQMVTSAPLLLHETSGILLLGLAITFTFVIFRNKMKKFGILGLASSILVLYSLLEGIVMNLFPIFQQPSSPAVNEPMTQFITSAVLPLLSAAGFLSAMVIFMLISAELWRLPDRTSHSQ